MKIFISYRSNGTAYFAKILEKSLKDEFGADSVFLDTQRISDGAVFNPIIQEFIEDSDALLAIIGADWDGDRGDGSRRIDDHEDVLGREVAMGLQQQWTLVIPVLIDDAEVPRRLPGHLQRLATLSSRRIRSRNEFDEEVRPLLKSLRAHDPDCQPRQVAAVSTEATLGWLSPGLELEELEAQDAVPDVVEPDSTIAISGDGVVVAQVVGGMLTIWSLADRRTARYGVWLHQPLADWECPRVVAVGRGGPARVRIALADDGSRPSLKWLDFEHGRSVARGRLSTAVHCAAFFGAMLTFVAPDKDSVRCWDGSGNDMTGPDVGSRPQWVDAVVADGQLFLAVLGHAHGDKAPLGCFRPASRQPEALTTVSPGPSQFAFAPSLQGTGRPRLAIKHRTWQVADVDVFGRRAVPKQ